MKGSFMVVSERLIVFTRFKVGGGGSGACNFILSGIPIFLTTK